MKNGFTLLEVIIVIAIMAVIATVVVVTSSRFSKTVSLKSDVNRIASIIYKARSDTISSRGGLQYGVHFEPGKVVLFQGDTYSVGSVTNQNFFLSSSIVISTINLTGGGSEVVFQRLTGVTLMPGSIIISNGSRSSTISISGNGIVTIE